MGWLAIRRVGLCALVILLAVSIDARAAGSAFLPGPRTELGGFPGAIAAGDFNHDGKADFAVATGNVVSILFGASGGRFVSGPSLPVAAGAIAAGDFNGDGNVDLAVAGPDVTILLGDGHGNFTQAAGSPVSVGVGVYSVTTGVIGGQVQIAAGGPSGVWLISQSADGTFSAGDEVSGGLNVTGIVAGYFTNDGNLDLAVLDGDASAVTLLLGDGSGGFAAGPPTSTGEPGGGFLLNAVSIAAGDFNADSHQDVAVGLTDGKLSVFLGDGHGGLTLAVGSPSQIISDGTRPISLAAADLNGDGADDLAVAGYAQGGPGRVYDSVSVLLSNRGGGFTPAAGSPYTISGVAESVATGDLNDDGRLDVVASERYSCQGSVVVPLINQGSGGASASGGTFPGDGCTIPRPVADCYDGYFTNVTDHSFTDSRPAASYCASATRANGYDGRVFHNATADAALTNAATDSLFYLDGHAFGPCWGSETTGTAGGLFFSDPLSLHVSVIGDVCGFRGTRVSGPVASLGGLKIAILQACWTFKDVRGHDSIGTQLIRSGVRTVLGFTGLVQFADRWGDKAGSYRVWGDAWAHAFWEAFGSGLYLGDAAHYALFQELFASNNQPAGYDSVRIEPSGSEAFGHGSGEYATLRAPRVRFQAQAASVRYNQLERALKRFVGRPLKHIQWIQGGLPPGKIDAAVPRIGLFTLDRQSASVQVASFERPPAGREHRLSLARARQRAAAFAGRHGGGLASMSVRRHVTLAVDALPEFMFVWQARRQGTWLPSYVDVSIRADGAITAYERKAIRLRTSIVPRISAAQAASRAERASGSAARLTGAIPQAEVLAAPSGGQRLVWAVPLKVSGGPGTIPFAATVRVDAWSGRVIPGG